MHASAKLGHSAPRERALRRNKSLPPPNLVFMGCSLDGMVHGTPEGVDNNCLSLLSG